MDKREQILVRIREILEGLDLFDTVVRNDIISDETNLPAAMLMDGDETAEDSGHGGKKPANATTRVIMFPEIYILLDGLPEVVGTLLNRYRSHVVYALLNDSELRALAVDGDVRYEGLQTGLALGRSMAGEMGLNIGVGYKFEPTVAPAPFASTEGTEESTEG
jgi:hypothetical protein